MEDYEKKYKQLHKFITDLYPHMSEYCKEKVEGFFPELAQSKDERIRKGLIQHLEILRGWTPDDPSPIKVKEHYDAWIAWLEKQGEPIEINPTEFDTRLQNLIGQFDSLPKEELLGSLGFWTNVVQNDGTYKDEKQGEQKPVDKVEPKFKNGQWIVWQDKCYKVNYNGCGYELVDQNGLSTSLEYGTIDENAHLWDITKDAKDGDVLVASDDSIFLFAGVVDWACKYYVALTTDNAVKFNEGLEHYWETSTAVHPATKEQCNLFFQKMEEAGYEWDSEKKELKKIEQKMINEHNEHEPTSYEVEKWNEAQDNANDSDWQSFRAEAAKDILCATLSGGTASGMIGIIPEKETIVKASIEIANELIKQLKEKEEK